MPKSILSIVVLVAAVMLISAAYTYVRGGELASADQIAAKGIAAARRDTAVFYAGVAVMVGVIGFFVFRGMINASPDTAAKTFLLIAIGIGVALEIMGAIVFKMRGIVELTLLHVLFIAAYGWVLPQVFPA